MAAGSHVRSALINPDGWDGCELGRVAGLVHEVQLTVRVATKEGALLWS